MSAGEAPGVSTPKIAPSPDGPDLAGAEPSGNCWYPLPHQTVDYVREHLRPAPITDTDRVAVLVTSLGNAKFAPRQEAEKELEKLGELAGPKLREALRDNPPLALRQRIERLLARAVGPVPAGDSIRDLRAIELLERIGRQGRPRSARGGGSRSPKRAIDTRCDGLPRSGWLLRTYPRCVD